MRLSVAGCGARSTPASWHPAQVVLKTFSPGPPSLVSNSCPTALPALCALGTAAGAAFSDGRPHPARRGSHATAARPAIALRFTLIGFPQGWAVGRPFEAAPVIGRQWRF